MAINGLKMRYELFVGMVSTFINHTWLNIFVFLCNCVRLQPSLDCNHTFMIDLAPNGFFLVPNQSENYDYNPNLTRFNKMEVNFILVCALKMS